jgi:hypothetical protein
VNLIAVGRGGVGYCGEPTKVSSIQENIVYGNQRMEEAF